MFVLKGFDQWLKSLSKGLQIIVTYILRNLRIVGKTWNWKIIYKKHFLMALFDNALWCILCWVLLSASAIQIWPLLDTCGKFVRSNLARQVCSNLFVSYSKCSRGKKESEQAEYRVHQYLVNYESEKKNWDQAEIPSENFGYLNLNSKNDDIFWSSSIFWVTTIFNNFENDDMIDSTTMQLYLQVFCCDRFQ